MPSPESNRPGWPTGSKRRGGASMTVALGRGRGGQSQMLWCAWSSTCFGVRWWQVAAGRHQRSVAAQSLIRLLRTKATRPLGPAPNRQRVLETLFCAWRLAGAGFSDLRPTESWQVSLLPSSPPGLVSPKTVWRFVMKSIRWPAAHATPRHGRRALSLRHHKPKRAGLVCGRCA